MAQLISCPNCNQPVMDSQRTCQTCGGMVSQEQDTVDRALLKTIKSTIAQIEEPLRYMLSMSPQDRPMEPIQLISRDLRDVARYIVNVDGRVTEKEAALFGILCGDLIYAMTDNEGFKHNIKNDKRNYFVYLYSFLSTSPVEVPLLTSAYLKAYDQSHNTHLSDAFHSMLFVFANALLKADGILTENGQRALQHLASILKSVIAFEIGTTTVPSDLTALKRSMTITIREAAERVQPYLTAQNSQTTFEASAFMELFQIALYFVRCRGVVTRDHAEIIHRLLGDYVLRQSPASKHWEIVEWMNFVQKLLDDTGLVLGGELAVLNVLIAYDRDNQTHYADKTRNMYARFANAFVSVDGKITQQEQQALSRLTGLLGGILPSPAGGFAPPLANSEAKKAERGIPVPEPKSDTLQENLNELNALIGLEAVKKEVEQLVNFLKVQQLRKTKGLGNVSISRHLVFYGNPGTGKTTIARILSRIYRSLNIIEKGHLVETDRSGLVAGYVGQTAIKTAEVVANALGGTLFIDEAYALKNEEKDAFGGEAIDTLLKLMEDHREQLVIIVAGYTGPMNHFLNSNPGLKSRFNTYLHFQDYDPWQLCNIYEGFCKNANYAVSESAKEKLLNVFTALHGAKDESFGNARLARNVFEKTISVQANRIVTIPNVSDSMLCAIEPADIPGIEDLMARDQEKNLTE